MILVGLGANLPSDDGAGPKETLEAALTALTSPEIAVRAVSPWFESEPVPVSDQPWFVNGVAELETALSPEALLTCLHACERQFGRVRREKNEARILDIDLLAYHDVVTPDDASAHILPHPRMHLRNFVLKPLAVLTPDWRHPVLGESAAELLEKSPDSGMVRPLQSGSSSV